jgi:hypothetical protein
MESAPLSNASGDTGWTTQTTLEDSRKLRAPRVQVRHSILTHIRWSRGTTALLAVVAVQALMQLIFLSPWRRYLTYDEAIYLSQVYPGVSPIQFNAQRARGLPWLLTPASLFSPPVWVIRLYVLVLLSALFFVAFRAWLPILRTRAVVAAALFGATWLALFYGSEIFPNPVVAFGGVTAAGYLSQHLVAGTRDGAKSWRALVMAAGALAFVTLVRPTEGMFIGIGMGIATVTLKPGALLVRWSAISAGVLIGWIPWVVEAYLSYGGLRARLQAASENVETGGSLHFDNALHHLALTDGPLDGLDPTGIPVIGVVWWHLLLAGALIAVAQRVRQRDQDHVAIVAAVAGLASALQYVLLTDVVQTRFLLPAYALLTVSLAATLPALTRPTTRVAAAALFVGWLAWNLNLADKVNDTQIQRRHGALELAALLNERAQGRECLFVSQFAFPEIEFASGCRGKPFNPLRDSIRLNRDPGTTPVYVLSRTPPSKSPILRRPGRIEQVRRPGARGWWLFMPEERAIFTWPQPPPAKGH